MIENKMYQTLILELSDRRLVSATVPAFCHIGDPISVMAIRVTEPKELPEGCSFEELEVTKEEEKS